MDRALERINYILIAAVFALIVIHAPLTVFLGTKLPGYELLLKSWKEILIVIGLGVLALDVTRRRAWALFLRDKFVWLVLAYAAYHFASLLWFYNGVNSTLSGLAINLRYVAFFALVYGFITLHGGYRARLVRIAIAGAVLVVGFAALQLFLPANILSHIGYGSETIAPYLTVDENQDLVRVNSTMRGPNPLGAYAVMVLAGVVAVGARHGWRLKPILHRYTHGFLALTGAVALWISYSRSALVAGVVAMLTVPAVALGRKLSWKVILSVIITLMLIVVGTLMLRDNHFVSQIIWHDDPNEGNNINSNEGHFDSLAFGFGRLLAQPLGAGVGSTGSASLLGDSPLIIENQYLFIAHEVGWLGLMLFIAMFAVVMWRLFERRQDWLALALFAGGFGLALIGLLLPVWVDDTVSIVWWGLVGLSLALGKGGSAMRTSKRT